ncbi:MAG: T9SS type A sorting domain-containing protein [Owenweeksia sp.]|nr:T9SS type A sorting domain-containing protein [Owenweeksia sp.]
MDGGSTWNLATADTVTFSNLYDIEIYKDGHVVAASNLPQGIEISTDRGHNFSQTASFPPLNSSIQMAYDGNQSIWATNIAGSQNANCYVSTDAGNTWNPWSAVPDGQEVKYIKPSILMIWGSADTTALSRDGGSTFSTVRFPATKPAGSLLRLRVGGDQQTYYVNDGNAKLWILSTGSGVGTAETPQISPVAMYPNPAANELFVDDYSGPVEIYNTSGKLLKSYEMVNNRPLDISSLPPGIMILKLSNGVKRLIKI